MSDRIPRAGAEWTIDARLASLDRAFVIGALSAQSYVALWQSLWRYGRRWRWN